MDKNKYISALLSLNYKSTFWMIVSAIMLLSNVMLSYFVMTADTSEKTIVTPPVIEKAFSVHGNELSPSYIEQMSRFFINLLLTYQKQTAESQFDTVLLYINPLVYSDMKNRFSLEQDRISRNDISSVFYIKNMHIKGDSAVISGELNGAIGSQWVSKKQKTYELQFAYDGQLSIIGFNELKLNSDGTYAVVKSDDDVLVEVDEVSNDSK